MRRFAFVNIFVWTAQHPLTVYWYLSSEHLRQRVDPFEFYLVQISIAALWLSSLAWWQSTRVEDKALTVEELVDRTTVEPVESYGNFER